MKIKSLVLGVRSPTVWRKRFLGPNKFNSNKTIFHYANPDKADCKSPYLIVKGFGKPVLQ